jgi:hypothetical protein
VKGGSDEVQMDPVEVCVPARGIGNPILQLGRAGAAVEMEFGDQEEAISDEG